MKYRILLAGKNKSLINDFFMQMDFSFECLSSSMRYSDLLGHIKYFKPHAFVFCMNAESKDDMTVVVNLHDNLKKAAIPLILICDEDDYNFFSKLPGSVHELLLQKPISLPAIQEKITKYLRQNTNEEEPVKKSTSSLAGNTQNTLELLSRLEKELDLTEAEPEADNNTEANPPSNRIMIIDDAPSTLKVIKEHLSPDYEVATAISGKIGLKFLQRKAVDLILLDYEMPEEDGPAVFEKLLANPKTANIPVVFLTGINDSAKIQKALSLKPKGYLLKPVDKDTLLAKVHEILG